MCWLGTVNIEMTPGEDGKRWCTVGYLAYISDEYGPGNGVVIEISPGLSTDGASIPRLLWRLIGCPLRGRYAPAALIHDGLYASQFLSRKTADDLFREMLRELGLSRLKMWAMHTGVRLGGGPAWRGKPINSMDVARRLVTLD